MCVYLHTIRTFLHVRILVGLHAIILPASPRWGSPTSSILDEETEGSLNAAHCRDILLRKQTPSDCVEHLQTIPIPAPGLGEASSDLEADVILM